MACRKGIDMNFTYTLMVEYIDEDGLDHTLFGGLTLNETMEKVKLYRIGFEMMAGASITQFYLIPEAGSDDDAD